MWWQIWMMARVIPRRKRGINIQTNKQFGMTVVFRRERRMRRTQLFQASVSSQPQESTHKSDYLSKVCKLRKLDNWICLPDGIPCGRSRGWWAWCTPRQRRAGWCRSTAGSTPFAGKMRFAMTNTGPLKKLNLRLFWLSLTDTWLSLTDTSRTSLPQWLNFPGLGLSSALPPLSSYPGLALLLPGSFLWQIFILALYLVKN